MEQADVTNTVASETPVPATVGNEENTVANQEPQVTPPATEGEQPVENSNQDVVDEQKEQEQTQPQKEDTQVKQPTIEELQSKLKEYEIRDEEEFKLRDKLGLGNMDSQAYNYMNIDQQIVNEGKQVYLRLCNEYGVDANPNNIDKSIEALKQSDPAKAYEFQRRFDNLANEVTSKRNYVKQENAVYEVSKFENEYNQLLNAAPALNNIMAQYVNVYGRKSPNMYNQLKGVMNVVLPAYQEAFEAGKRFALQDRAKQDTSGVQGGIATANTNTYSQGATFTRDQIARMSSEDFAKYENVIKQQMLEGKIQ